MNSRRVLRPGMRNLNIRKICPFCPTRSCLSPDRARREFDLNEHSHQYKQWGSEDQQG